METLGEKIKRVRKSKGLSQKELAEKAGITQSALVAIEKNKTKNIFLEVAKGIAKALNVSFDFLYETDEENKIERFLEIIRQKEGELELERRMNKLMLEYKTFDRSKSYQLEKLNYIVSLYRYFDLLDFDLFFKLNPNHSEKEMITTSFKLSFVEDFVNKYGDQSLTEIQKYLNLDKYIASDVDLKTLDKEKIIEYIRWIRPQLEA